MTEGFVIVNGVSTHVITWGGWVEDKLNADHKELVLLITGNPGLAERMAESPNGKLMTGIIKHIVPVMLFLVWIFTFFPVPIKKILLSVHFIVRRMPTYHVAPTMKLMNPTVLGNVMFLALEEMDKVKELDDKSVRDASDLLFLYYGTTDGWVPLQYWKDMAQNHPEIKCMVCEKGIDHAFVLRYNNEMADILSDLIQEHL
ncbi:hypothetical protein Cfor_09305 [Coptotermes formosanus]|uniref:Lipid droplet-associated hydrolase n=1 Tax=Coptotermes formosanus TaxID=36987 RepID=A0A6L2PH35_COPFO|nr:hypothetical protein Cfor_09305 [Coptotermes formosanus]